MPLTRAWPMHSMGGGSPKDQDHSPFCSEFSNPTRTCSVRTTRNSAARRLEAGLTRRCSVVWSVGEPIFSSPSPDLGLDQDFPDCIGLLRIMLNRVECDQDVRALTQILDRMGHPGRKNEEISVSRLYPDLLQNTVFTKPHQRRTLRSQGLLTPQVVVVPPNNARFTDHHMGVFLPGQSTRRDRLENKSPRIDDHGQFFRSDFHPLCSMPPPHRSCFSIPIFLFV
jgi:hypothetical protein